MKMLTRTIGAGALVVALMGGSTGAFAASYKYTVTLKPVTVKNSTGTPVTLGSGTATITLYPARWQICYSITVHSIKLPAKGAYIKTGTNTTVVTLVAPGSSGTSSGCVRRGLRRSTINAIHSSPASYRLVISNTKYLNGVLMGKL